MKEHSSEAAKGITFKNDLGRPREPKVPVMPRDAYFLLASDPEDVGFRDTMVHRVADDTPIGGSMRSSKRGSLISKE